MSNLTGLQNGVFNTLQLIDDTAGDQQEVRQLFLQGSLKHSIPNNRTANQVLSIPGLLPELNARQLIVNSYSKTEVDTIVQNNQGPKGDKGEQGASVSGPKGSKGLKGITGASSTGSKGANGDQGSLGQKGDQGLGSKGQKGGQGQKGEQGQAGTNVYTKAEVDAQNSTQNTSINNNSHSIINTQVDVSGLQFQENLLQRQINAINVVLTSLQNQINAIPAPLKVEAAERSMSQKNLTLQGSGIGSVGWFVNTEDLVFSFQ